MLYYFHYQEGDTTLYFSKAYTFRDWPISSFLVYIFSEIDLAQPSRAILFTRIVAAVAYVTRGDYWILSAYFSCFSFFGVSYLVSQMIQVWKSIKWPAIVTFFFYPTAVFWSSGLIKESLAFGGMGFLIGAVLSYVYIKKNSLGAIICAILGGVLLITLKYYIAALTVPFLTFLIFYKKSASWRIMPKSILKRVTVIIMGLLLPGLFFLRLISQNFRWERFFEILEISHNDILDKSSLSNRVEVLEVFSNAIDYLLNILYYMISGLFRPFILGEWLFPNWISIVENVFVLILLIFFMLRINTWKNHVTVESVLSIIYVLAASTILTYAIPNLGSIARFKVYYMPLLVLLLIYTLRKYLIDKRV